MSLEEIFEEQKQLNTRINPDLYQEIKDPEIKRKRFLEFELALRQECSETVDSLNWKWWKKTEDDWDNVKIELIDILHFWVSMCTIAEISSQEVIDLYFKKNNLNHVRQDKGYKDGTYDKMKNSLEDNKSLL
ncbi:MAG: dUTPase [Candidatus Margulisiibacteriota bacterium]|jgi:dimeric dUTPase (all-alpha-NTP-PPase superfamily)